MRSIGKYEILAELGRGGMGVVYRARDPLINRLVALKTITSDMSENKALLERFYVEARSAGNLQHPSIVTLYELGEHDGFPFIAMEYIEGETLERMIARKPDVPLAVKLGYIVRIGEGLRFAHERGVIHRDVKPANIMVTADGVVKIVDFGIARLKDTSMTQANLVLGSRAYMAPQLYEGQRADARSDIWALGVTFYELVAYQKPFSADSEAALMFKVLREDPPPLRDLCPDRPEALEKVVRRMLERSVTARYQSMDELLVDLRNLWEKAQEETVPPLLAESRRLMEAHDDRAAQDLLRQILQIDNANLPAKSLFDQVSREVRRQELLPRVQEHVDRGRMHLQKGDLVEARAEAESALGLDTRCESAQQLRREVDEEAQRAEQLDQRLKSVKQRLLDGALTEAMQALEQATDLSASDARVQELKKHLVEEQARREKREKLSRANRHARDLWMEQNYPECLAALEDALKEFPSDRELLKLRETARQDWAEEEKQRRLGQARKYLGQQRFAEAGEIVADLAMQHPQDTAVKTLMALVEQGEEEKKRRERLESELVKIRKLVREEQYEAALAQGGPLLREYPEEFELKELVGYARAEWTQHQLRRKAQDQENHIQELLRAWRYAEAAAAAQRATQEFPGRSEFRRLWDEAERKRKDEEARQEFQGRIQEIQRMISRQDLTDAIDLAQQTLATMGYDQDVSQLLRAATAEQEEKNHRREQEKLHDVRTLVDAGKSEEATRMLHDAFATQILQPSHPQAQELLTLIQKSPPATQTGTMQAGAAARPGMTPSASPPSTGAPVGPWQFSATSVLSQTPPPVAPVSEPPASYSTVENDTAAASVGAVPHAAGRGQIPVTRPQPIRGPESVRTKTKTEHRTKAATLLTPVVSAAQALERYFAQAVSALKSSLSAADPILRRRTLITLIICFVVIGISAVAAVLWNISRKSRQLDAENLLRAEAQQLWDQHEPDQSEEKWKHIAALHGPLETQATQQIALIDKTRNEERQRFENAQNLFQKDSKDPQARHRLQEVVEMRLWHALDAQNLVANITPSPPAPQDLSKQEQALFAEGEQLLAGGNYDAARRRFRDLINLNVPNSTLVPRAQEYLNKIRSSNDDKKNYDAAAEDFQNENWNAAAEGFTRLSIAKAL